MPPFYIFQRSADEMKRWLCLLLCVAMIGAFCFCLASCHDDGENWGDTPPSGDGGDAPPAGDGGDTPGGTSDAVLPDVDLGDGFKGGLDPDAWT